MAVPDRLGTRSFVIFLLLAATCLLLLALSAILEENAQGLLRGLASGCAIALGSIGILLGLLGVITSPYKRWRSGMPKTGPFNPPMTSWTGIILNSIAVAVAILHLSLGG